MSYSSYDHDDLEPASTMRIERQIYFESGKADLSEAVKLPLAELLSLRAESAAAEQEVFDRLKEQAAAWEEQDVYKRQRCICTRWATGLTCSQTAPIPTLPPSRSRPITTFPRRLWRTPPLPQ